MNDLTLTHLLILEALEIEDIPSGITNFCFKVFDSNYPGQAVFIKHSKDFIRRWDAIPLTSQRLQYEYEGLLAFSKHAKDFIPQVIRYHHERKILINEWLHDYTSLRDCFIQGVFDASYARKMGTLMGRSHGRHFNQLPSYLITSARSHSQVVPEKVDKYSHQFANPEHLHMWDVSLFTPLRNMLIAKEIPEVEESLLTIIEKIRDIYLNKKQV